MTSNLTCIPPRVFGGTIIEPVTERGDRAYRDIASSNTHLHKVVNALLKERSGQPLTAEETNLIGLTIAAKLWQLKHQHKDVS